MSYSKYLVPRDTLAVLTLHHLRSCQNFGLMLARYAPQEAIEDTNRVEKGKNVGKERNFWLNDICGNFNPNADLIADHYTRWQAMTTGAKRFSMKTRSRLIVGLGGKGALEFGITLHPVTGLPYIPGNALKGLCRSYKLLELAAQCHVSPLPSEEGDSELDTFEKTLIDPKETAEQAVQFRHMFGTQEAGGQCVFHDAVLMPLPEHEGTSLFELDVLTPHFPDYYSKQGKSDAPHDGQGPIPFTFITVATEIGFAFAVGLRHNATAGKDVAIHAHDILIKALQEMGIGAKTAAGYGVFGDARELKVKKTSIDVGDEVRGEVYEVDQNYGIWFGLDGDTQFKYEGVIPKESVLKWRKNGERIKAQVISIQIGATVRLICQQIIN